MIIAVNPSLCLKKRSLSGKAEGIGTVRESGEEGSVFLPEEQPLAQGI